MTRYVGGVLQSVTSVGAVAQATVTGLMNGTTYTSRVAAKNAVGTGPASVESNAVTPTAPRFALTITNAGTGGGNVASNPSAVSCGAICTRDFDAGTAVTLTATPDAGSTFVGWSGACTGTGQYTVTMDAAKAAVAGFNQILQPTPAKPVFCVVPNVRGKPLAIGKKRIAAGHCRRGKVTTSRSNRVAKGRVISRSPKSGARLRSGSKVSLVVSRGRR